jgi:hypothetical protein
MNWPEDSVQAFANAWWEDAPTNRIRRGALLNAWVPYTDQVPKEILFEESIGLPSERRYQVRSVPFDGEEKDKVHVPGIILKDDETLLGAVAKSRPVLVLSEPAPEFQKRQWPGMAAHQRISKFTVAPYFGVEHTGERGGYDEIIVRLARRGRYAHLMWDWLPGAGAPSLLRLDCLTTFTLGNTTVTHTGKRLSSEALLYLDDWFLWMCRGGECPRDSSLGEVRDLIEQMLPSPV